MSFKERLEKVAVVFLNYNGGQVTENALRSLGNQKILPGRFIFVDNGSTEFNADKYRECLGPKFVDYTPIEFLRLNENQGYVGGMNTGIAHALKNSSGWIMTLSNDTELAPEFFENLKIFLSSTEFVQEKRHKLGAIAPKIFQMKDKTVLDATGLSLCLDGMSSARGQRQKDSGQYDHQQEITMPNGVAAIYHSDALRDVGLMDPKFQSYCEDTDLGIRLWLAGWNCRFLPECVLYHARSFTMGEFSLKKLYLVERNHYWVVLKNLPFFFVLWNPIFTCYRFLVQLFAILMKKGQGQGFGNFSKIDLIRTVLKAMIDAFKGIPYCLKYRLTSKKRRGFFETYFKLIKNRMKISNLILD